MPNPNLPYEVSEQDLINDPDIDIVDVCTPNLLHSQVAVAALQASPSAIQASRA